MVRNCDNYQTYYVTIHNSSSTSIFVRQDCILFIDNYIGSKSMLLSNTAGANQSVVIHQLSKRRSQVGTLTHLKKVLKSHEMRQV
jgi:hypothetical protein